MKMDAEFVGTALISRRDVVEGITGQVQLPYGMKLRVHSEPISIQVHHEGDICNVTKQPNYAWQSRRWLVEPADDEASIVKTCFAAFMLAMEHEAREKFVYCDRLIFGPHTPVDQLYDIADRVSDDEYGEGN